MDKVKFPKPEYSLEDHPELPGVQYLTKNDVPTICPFKNSPHNTTCNTACPHFNRAFSPSTYSMTTVNPGKLVGVLITCSGIDLELRIKDIEE